MSTGISMDRVDQIIDSYGCQRHHLIAIMQDIQAEYKYLSPEVLERIAEKLDVGVAKVYSVATFYENFSLEAKGKYIIKVCDGTACHVPEPAALPAAPWRSMTISRRSASAVGWRSTSA